MLDSSMSASPLDSTGALWTEPPQGVPTSGDAPSPFGPMTIFTSLKHCAWADGLQNVFTFCLLPPIVGSLLCEEHALLGPSDLEVGRS